MHCVIYKESEFERMTNQVVKAKRDAIAACMTCPVCDKLFRDATTIIECLHTFCRKCIYKKFSDEELECCPVCNIDLGGSPEEKLRPDHNLQDVRVKIFPSKRKTVKEPDADASVASPAKRKERSLSSLVVNTPKVSTQAALTGKRTKGIARKASNLRGTNFSVDKAVKKEEDADEGHHESSSSPETLKKFSQSMRQTQTSSRGETSQSIHNNGKRSNLQPCDGKLDPWKPLHCLVEVANRSKSFKSTSQGADSKQVTCLSDNEAQERSTKSKENKIKLKVENEKNNSDPLCLDAAKGKKLRRIRQKKEGSLGESGITLQSVVDAASGRYESRSAPIWFSLVASKEQDGDASLPQVPANYLKIKDGSMPVSFIQKYLMRKLDLTSEAEVEIKCMGKPVLPTLQLYNLVDMWLQSAPTSERLPAKIGSSAKDFVMVLGYSRKVHGS